MCDWGVVGYCGAGEPRPFYPELAAFAPTGDNLPNPNNLADGRARELLNIKWMVEPAVVLVIDRSGSMDGDPLANVKASAYERCRRVICQGKSVNLTL